MSHSEEEYKKTCASLQRYIPFLENMIQQLKDPTKKNRDQQLAKMESLHSMIVDKKKKLKIETLIKCEEVILKLYKKVKGDNAPLPRSAPASPSPTRDLGGHIPLEIPTERRQKIDIYSSAGESLARNMPFQRQSVFNRLGNRSYLNKPLISYDDLDVMQITVQNALEAQSSTSKTAKQLSLEQLTEMQKKLKEELKLADKELAASKSPSKERKSEKKTKSPKKQIEAPKTDDVVVINDSPDSNKEEKQDSIEVEPPKKADVTENKTKKLEAVKLTIKSKPPEIVLKEPASIFGDALSGIDEKIIGKKKDRKSIESIESIKSDTSNKEKSHSPKSDKSKTTEKSHSKSSTDSSRSSSKDRKSSKTHEKSSSEKDSSKHKSDKKKSERRSSSSKEDKHKKDRKSSTDSKESSKTEAKLAPSEIKEPTSESSVNNLDTTRNSIDMDVSCSSLNESSNLIIDTSKLDQSVQNSPVKPPTRIALKFNPKPKKKTEEVVVEIDKEITNSIEESMKKSTVPIPFLGDSNVKVDLNLDPLNKILCNPENTAIINKVVTQLQLIDPTKRQEPEKRPVLPPIIQDLLAKPGQVTYPQKAFASFEAPPEPEERSPELTEFDIQAAEDNVVSESIPIGPMSPPPHMHQSTFVPLQIPTRPTNVVPREAPFVNPRSLPFLQQIGNQNMVSLNESLFKQRGLLPSPKTTIFPQPPVVNQQPLVIIPPLVSPVHQQQNFNQGFPNNFDNRMPNQIPRDPRDIHRDPREVHDIQRDPRDFQRDNRDMQHNPREIHRDPREFHRDLRDIQRDPRDFHRDFNNRDPMRDNHDPRHFHNNEVHPPRDFPLRDGPMDFTRDIPIDHHLPQHENMHMDHHREFGHDRNLPRDPRGPWDPRDIAMNPRDNREPHGFHRNLREVPMQHDNFPRHIPRDPRQGSNMTYGQHRQERMRREREQKEKEEKERLEREAKEREVKEKEAKDKEREAKEKEREIKEKEEEKAKQELEAAKAEAHKNRDPRLHRLEKNKFDKAYTHKEVDPNEENFVSPLDSLYTTESGKTGKGYGTQTFKIPKKVEVVEKPPSRDRKTSESSDDSKKIETPTEEPVVSEPVVKIDDPKKVSKEDKIEPKSTRSKTVDKEDRQKDELKDEPKPTRTTRTSERKKEAFNKLKEERNKKLNKQGIEKTDVTKDYVEETITTNETQAPTEIDTEAQSSVKEVQPASPMEVDSTESHPEPLQEPTQSEDNSQPTQSEDKSPETTSVPTVSSEANISEVNTSEAKTDSVAEISSTSDNAPQITKEAPIVPTEEVEQKQLNNFLEKLMKTNKTQVLLALISSFSDNMSEDKINQIKNLLTTEDESKKDQTVTKPSEATTASEIEPETKSSVQTKAPTAPETKASVETDLQTPTESETQPTSEVETPMETEPVNEPSTSKEIEETPQIETEKPSDDDAEIAKATEVQQPLEIEIPTESETKKRPQTPKTPKQRPHKTELDKLHEDIKEMFISHDVMTPNGRRLCNMFFSERVQERNQKEALLSPTEPKKPFETTPKRVAEPVVKKADTKKVVETKKAAETTTTVVEKRKGGWKKGVKRGPKSKMLLNQKAHILDVKIILNKLEEDKKIQKHNEELEEEKKGYSLRRSRSTNYSEIDDEEQKKRKSPEPPQKEESPKKDDPKPKEPEKETPKQVKGPRKRKFNKWASGIIQKPKKKGQVGKKADSDDSDNDDLDDAFLPDVNHYETKGEIKCKLCTEVSSQLPAHYREKHSDYEVLCSRLAPERAAIVLAERSPKPIPNKLVVNDEKRFGYDCRVCDAKRICTPTIFYDHISEHTGEFRFSCKLCKYSRSSLKLLQKHMINTHKTQSSAHISTSETVNYRNMLGYMCVECNYVQMSREKLKEHVNVYHLENSEICEFDFHYKPSKSLNVTPVTPNVTLNTTIELNTTTEQEDDSEMDDSSSTMSFSSSKSIQFKNRLPKKVIPSRKAKTKIIKPILSSDKDKTTTDDESERTTYKKPGPLSKKITLSGKPYKKPGPKSKTQLIESSDVEEQPPKVRKKPGPKPKPKPQKEPSKPETEDESSIEEEIEEPVERPGPLCKKKNPPRQVEASVFTSATDINEDNKKIEEERLKTMEALNERVPTRNSLSFTTKLSDRLKESQLEIKPEPVDRDDDLPQLTRQDSDPVLVINDFEVDNIISDSDDIGPPPLKHVNELELKKPFLLSSILDVGPIRCIKDGDSMIYSCLIPPCIFTTKDQDNFLSHCYMSHDASRHQSFTNCKVCQEEIVIEQEELLLKSFFEHVIEKHSDFVPKEQKESKVGKIRISSNLFPSDIDTDNSAAERTDSDMCLTPGAAEVDDPFSSIKIIDVMSLANEVPPLSPLQNVQQQGGDNLGVVDENPTSNTDGSSSKQQKEKESPPAITAMKSESAIASFLTRPNLLFKCPEYYCEYSTNFSKLFEVHIKCHKNMSESTSVYCVYCNKFMQLSQLSEHYYQIHSMCKWTCCYCMYRCLNKDYMDIHLLLKHHDKEQHSICLKSSDGEEITKNLNVNFNIVQKYTLLSFRCCFVEYPFYDSFLSHLTNCKRFVNGKGPCFHQKPGNKNQNPGNMEGTCGSIHSIDDMIKHWGSAHGVFVMQCAYCQFGSNQSLDVMVHSALEHPYLPPDILDRTCKPSGVNEQNLTLKDIGKIRRAKTNLKLTKKMLTPYLTNTPSSESPSPPVVLNHLIQEKVTETPPKRFTILNPSRYTLLMQKTPEPPIILNTEASLKTKPEQVKLVRLSPSEPKTALTLVRPNFTIKSKQGQVLSPTSKNKLITPLPKNTNRTFVIKNNAGTRTTNVVSCPANVIPKNAVITTITKFVPTKSSPPTKTLLVPVKNPQKTVELTQTTAVSPQTTTLSQKTVNLPQKNTIILAKTVSPTATSFPVQGGAILTKTGTLPQKTTVLPQKTAPLPQLITVTPQKSPVSTLKTFGLPQTQPTAGFSQTTSTLPQKTGSCPQKTAETKSVEIPAYLIQKSSDLSLPFVITSVQSVPDDSSSNSDPNPSQDNVPEETAGGKSAEEGATTGNEPIRLSSFNNLDFASEFAKTVVNTSKKSITIPPPETNMVRPKKPVELTYDSDSNNAIDSQPVKKIQLYKCDVCQIAFSNGDQLKEHLVKSEHKIENTPKPYKCAHCTRLMKSPQSLIEHLEYHGPLRYSCSLCDQKFPSGPKVRTHMKFQHNVHSHVLVKRGEEFILRPKPQETLDKSTELQSSTTEQQKSQIPDQKTEFYPNEIDQLPVKSIFSYEITCGQCKIFKNKVRTNIVRHLQLHANESFVPETAPVNPVPCLEKKEKMFDKMFNLAASSVTSGGSRMGGPSKESKNETTEAQTDDPNIPAFIPATRRYVCCSTSCNYLCPEEGNLKHHLMALHNGELSFTCPHCKKRLLSDVDSIIKHLKLHNLHLYKCSACDFVHNLKHKVDRHGVDKHDFRVSTVTVRYLDAEPVDEFPAMVAPSTGKVFKPWKCGMCKYRCLNEDDIVLHVNNKHDINSRFKCALCFYKSNDYSKFTEHFRAEHPTSELDVIHIYYKVAVEASSDSNTEEIDNSPLWQRNKPRVRHIRGILFDDVAETVAKPVEKPKKSPLKAHIVQVNESKTKKLANRKRSMSTITEIIDIRPSKEAKKQTPREEIIVIDSEDEGDSINVETFTKTTRCKTETADPVELICKYGELGMPTTKHFICPVCNQFKSRSPSTFILHVFGEFGFHKYSCTECTENFPDEKNVTFHCDILHEGERTTISENGVPKGDLLAWVNLVIKKQKEIINSLSADSGLEVQQEIEQIMDDLTNNIMPTTTDEFTDPQFIKLSTPFTLNESETDPLEINPESSKKRPTCGDSADTKPTKKHKSGRKSEDDDYNCLVCDFRGTEREQYEHSYSTHNKSKPTYYKYTCGYCGNRNVGMRSFKIHHTRNHEPSPMVYINTNKDRVEIKCDNSLKKVYKCTKCSYISKADNVNNIRAHMKCHWKPFKCSICGDSFRARSDARIHQNREHNLEDELQIEDVESVLEDRKQTFENIVANATMYVPDEVKVRPYARKSTGARAQPSNSTIDFDTDSAPTADTPTDEVQIYDLNTVSMSDNVEKEASLPDVTEISEESDS